MKETIFYFHGVNTNSLLARDSLPTIFNSTILLTLRKISKIYLNAVE